MLNSIEQADTNNSLSIVNTGTLSASTGDKAAAQLILGSDGKEVKKIAAETKLTAKREVVGSVKLTINIGTGKLDVEVADAANSFFGRANVDLTVDGEKVPEIDYQRRYMDDEIFSDASVARLGEQGLTTAVNIDVGERLKQLRLQHHLTQKEMRDKFTRTTPQKADAYCKWERGVNAIPIDFLRQVSECWDVDLNWLIRGTPIVKPMLTPDVINAITALEDFKRECQFGN